MSLRQKLILTLGLSVVLIISIVFYFLEINLKTHLKEQAFNNLRVIAEINEGAYFMFIETLKTRVLDWSSDGYIREMAEKITESQKESDINELSSYLRERKMPYDHSVILVDVLDKNGIVVASSRDERLGLDEKAEEEKIKAHRFSEAINSDFGESFTTSMIYEFDEHDEPMIHLVTKIFSLSRDSENKFKPLDAVLLIHFSETSRFGNILSGKWQEGEGALSGQALYDNYKTAETYLVNSDRLMITPSRFIEDSILKINVNTKPVEECFEREKEVVGEYLNYAGEKVFGASMCLKRDNAVLITEVKPDEIFTPTEELKKDFILSGFLVVFLSLLMIILLSQLLLRELKSVSDAADKISEGDLSARIKTKSKDEIGRLAIVFNKMLDKIENSRLELEKVNSSLTEKVKGKTSELEMAKNSLEREVSEQTVQLKEKLSELEKFKKLTIGRELKMIELKKKIEELEKGHGDTSH
ncbi:MAG: methyl-accepting chemotaxis protein [Patescibacteria group bacterium]|mgnify:CR=1 FL=1